MPKRRAQISGFSDAATAKAVLIRLISVTKGSNFQLSPQMLEEIVAISIEGADPDWKMSELRKILDRWVTHH